MNDSTWYHTYTGTLCVAGHDPATGLCAEGGGPVMSDAVLADRVRWLLRDRHCPDCRGGTGEETP